MAQQLGAVSPGQLSEVQGQYREAIKKKLEEVGLGLMFQGGCLWRGLPRHGSRLANCSWARAHCGFASADCASPLAVYLPLLTLPLLTAWPHASRPLPNCILLPRSVPRSCGEKRRPRRPSLGPASWHVSCGHPPVPVCSCHLLALSTGGRTGPPVVASQSRAYETHTGTHPPTQLPLRPPLPQTSGGSTQPRRGCWSRL